MKKFLKYSEFLIFALVNLFFAFGIFFLNFIFSLFTKNGEIFDENIIFYLFTMFFVWLVFLFFKFFTLLVLYWLRIVFPNIHILLFKIKNCKIFRIKFFKYILFFDTSILLIILFLNNFDLNIVYFYLLSAGGIFPCYLFFLFILKLFKPISRIYKIK